ncbi:MAG: hypothetical protein R3B82_18815 [Sandaracinaceae bacterium]
MSIEHQNEGIDAVRRLLHVLRDARTARDRRVTLIDGAGALSIEVPSSASERGPGQVRLTVGPRVFGDLAGESSLWAAWALAMSGEPLTDDLSETAHGFVSYEDLGQDALRDPLQMVLAPGAVWQDARLGDGDAARALRSIGQNLPAREVLRDIDPGDFCRDPPGCSSRWRRWWGTSTAGRRFREDAELVMLASARSWRSTPAGMNDAPNDWHAPPPPSRSPAR